MSIASITTDAPPLTDDQERAWLAHLAACLKHSEFDRKPSGGLTDYKGKSYRESYRELAADEVIRTRANFHAIRVRDGLGDFTWAGRTWRLGRDGFEMIRD